MNERIRKLIEEVVRVEIDPDSNMETIYTCGPEDFEAFAELIVRECVKVMYDNAIERKVPPDINQTPTHYAIAVLEHFGVKE